MKYKGILIILTIIIFILEAKSILRAQHEKRLPAVTPPMPPELHGEIKNSLLSSDPLSRKKALLIMQRECALSSEKPCRYIKTFNWFLLYDPNLEIRLEVLRLLGELREPSTIPSIVNILIHDKEPRMRYKAAYILTTFNDQEAKDALKFVARYDHDLKLREYIKRLWLKKTTQEKLVPQKKSLSDPDPTRVIYAPSAHSRMKGNWSFTSFNTAYWNFAYGITDDLDISLRTLVPMGIYLINPTIKVRWELSKYARIAMMGHVAILGFFLIEDIEDRKVYTFSGGAIFTYGTRDTFLNFSVFYLSALTNEKHGYLIMPSIGGSIKIHRRVKLNIEVHHLILPQVEKHGYGKIWGILYGLRIYGHNIFGDISFAIPIIPEVTREILSIFPIGIPFLSFGINW
jgi:hypothetical protein